MVMRCASTNPYVDLALLPSPFVSFVIVLSILGSLLVLPGPHPRVDPNSKASDTWSPIKKLKWCHLNGALMVVVACKLGPVARTIPNVFVGPTHTYATQPSKNWFVPSVNLSISRTCCTKVQWCSQGLLGNSSKIVLQT
jgi:hypothetical protein